MGAWFLGIVLILIGFGTLFAGLKANDWSDGSDNWNQIDKFKTHVTEENGDIKNVYISHGYLVVQTDSLNFRGKDANASAGDIDSIFRFAKKSNLSNKGLIIYQSADDSDNNELAILYDHKDLQKAPSDYDIMDNYDVLLTKATAYRLSGGAFNSSKFSQSLDIDSHDQPKKFADFCDSKKLYNSIFI